MTRGQLFAILKVLLALGLLAWLIHRHALGEDRIPFDQLARLKTTWPWFLGAVGVFGVILMVAAQRWRIVLSTQQLEFGFRPTFAWTLVGMFFNQVLLGATGGDVAKAWYVASSAEGRRTAAVLTVFVDRAIGLIVLVWLAAFAALINWESARESELIWWTVLTIYALAVASIIGLLLLAIGGLRERPVLRSIIRRLPFQASIQKLADSVAAYRSHPMRLVRIVLLSLTIHILVVAMHWIFLRCLGESSIDLLDLVFIVPVTQIVLAIPITPAGLGTGEAAYKHLFDAVGVGSGLLVAVLLRATYLIWGCIGGLLYMRLKRGAASRRKDCESACVDVP